MAFDSPPWCMDGTNLDAEVIRRAVATLPVSPTGGIVNAGDLALSQNATPNMSVNMGVGQVWVPGTSTASQGPYYSRNGASINLPVTASNPSNPRVDTVIVQVQDAFYAGSAKQLAPAVLAGAPTPAASLTNPVGLHAVPASSLVVGYVLVPANATSILTVDIAMAAPLAGQSIFSPGDLKASAAPNPPSGWLACDGSPYSRAIYAALFTAIGSAYGAGDGSTTFNVPDFRGRTILGAGAGPGLTPRSNGQTGGAETQTVDQAHLPNSPITVTDPGHSHAIQRGSTSPTSEGGPGTGPIFDLSASSGSNYSSTQPAGTGITAALGGGGQALPVLDPFAVATILIKT